MYTYLENYISVKLMHPILVHQNGQMALVIQLHSMSGVTAFTSCKVLVLLNPSYSVNLLGWQYIVEEVFHRCEVAAIHSSTQQYEVQYLNNGSNMQMQHNDVHNFTAISKYVYVQWNPS